MSKNKEMDVIFEIEKLKAKVNKLERYYHSNLKYIKQLYAKIDSLEKNLAEANKKVELHTAVYGPVDCGTR